MRRRHVKLAEFGLSALLLAIYPILRFSGAMSDRQYPESRAANDERDVVGERAEVDQPILNLLIPCLVHLRVISGIAPFKKPRCQRSPSRSSAGPATPGGSRDILRLPRDVCDRTGDNAPVRANLPPAEKR